MASDPFAIPLDLQGSLARLERAALEKQVWQLGLALAGAIRKFGDDDLVLHLDPEYLNLDGGESIAFAAFGTKLYCRIVPAGEDDGG